MTFNLCGLDLWKRVIQASFCHAPWFWRIDIKIFTVDKLHMLWVFIIEGVCGKILSWVRHFLPYLRLIAHLILCVVSDGRRLENKVSSFMVFIKMWTLLGQVDFGFQFFVNYCWMNFCENFMPHVTFSCYLQWGGRFIM